jgi:hypothetical protein
MTPKDEDTANHGNVKGGAQNLRITQQQGSESGTGAPLAPSLTTFKVQASFHFSAKQSTKMACSINCQCIISL